MNVHDVLSAAYDKDEPEARTLTRDDWLIIESVIGGELPELLKEFLAAAVQFRMQLDLLTAPSGSPGSIDSVILGERRGGVEMLPYVPFVVVGNGDYFCISLNKSGVFYWDHETYTAVQISGALSDWIANLPRSAFQ